LNLKPLSLARNVSLLKLSKCRLILESSFINASVAAQYCDPKRAIVVFSVHIQTSIVHRSKKKTLAKLRVCKSSRWVLQIKSVPTKRAVDGGDSAASTSIFLTSGFLCSQAFSQPAPPPLPITCSVKVGEVVFHSNFFGDRPRLWRLKW
jgi:hypothetical protein